MPGELVGQSGSPRRPVQKGTLSGTALGTTNPLTRKVEWLVDTGSDVVVVPQQLAQLFNLKLVGGGTVAQGVGGGLNLLPRRGLTVSFEVQDAAGAARTESHAETVFVGGTGSIILGMRVLALSQAELTWKPKTSKGRLTAP